MIWLPAVTSGQVQSPPDSGANLYREAVEQRHLGHSVEAASLLEQSLRDSSEFVDASVLLAEIYIRDLNNPTAAEHVMKERLRSTADRGRYESLDLLHRFHFPPALLPNLHKVRIARTARKLLETDSTNFAAHTVLGALALERYVSLKDAVNISSNDLGDITDEDISAIEPVFAGGSSNRTKVQYESRGIGFENQITTVEKAAFSGEHFDRARHHLDAAVQQRPMDSHTYTSFARLFAEARDFSGLDSLAQIMLRNRPADANGYLYAGLGQYYTGKPREAARSFARALQLMDPATKAEYLNIAGILNEQQRSFFEQDPSGFSSTFWLFSDPRYLTGYNERRLEHYARMVYSDLRFGQMFSGMWGWNTEPGQVIVRYGIPPGESTFSTNLDSYHTMTYPEFGFRFMDLAKAGKLTFYSPKASGAPNFEAIRRAWNDDTIRSAEYFREQPQVSRYDAFARRVAVTQAQYYFKSETGGKTDLVASVEIPYMNTDAPVDVDTGLFILQNGNVSRSIRQVSLDEESLIVSHSLKLQPGTATGSIEFDTPGDLPVGFETITIDVPDYSKSPSVSSLVVAELVEELSGSSIDTRSVTGFTRSDHWIAPRMSSVFLRGAPLYTYFEVYNLGKSIRGEYKYRVEAFLIDDKKNRGIDKTIRRLSRRRSGRGVAVAFDRSINSSSEPVYLVVDTTDNGPGRYILAIRITDLLTDESVYSAAAVELL
ncbi:MAG: GWxTD domain-containing protein [Rhodothermales bacterium]|nr:GWxTD domain-containing protein [Rhodothermales bacterium]